MNVLSSGRLGQIASWSGVTLSALLTIYLVLGVGRLIYVLIGVLSLLACMFWVTRGRRLRLISSYHLTRRAQLVLFGAFTSLFAIALLTLRDVDGTAHRPLLFFVIMSVLLFVSALQALGGAPAGLVLVQITSIGLLNLVSHAFARPDVIGIDPWYHRSFTTALVGSGEIPMGFEYSFLPGYHLLVATVMEATATEYRTAALLAISIPVLVVNLLTVFLLGRTITRDPRVGGLSALILVSLNYHVLMTYQPIPNSLAAAFIPLGMYIIIRSSTTLSSQRNWLLILVFILAILVFTHTITSLAMAMLMGIVWIVGASLPTIAEKKPFSVAIPLAFSVAMISWWMYASGHFAHLVRLINWGFELDRIIPRHAAVDVYIASVPLAEQVFSYVGFLLFFSVSFIGVFFLASEKGNVRGFTLATTGMAFLGVGFVSLLFRKYSVEIRWWFLAELLLSVCFGLACVLLSGLSSRHRRVGVTVVAAAVALIGFTLLLSPTTNVENTVMSPHLGVNYGLTETDLAVVGFLDHVAVPFYADWFFSHTLEFGFHREGAVPLDEYLFASKLPSSGNMTVIRTHAFDGVIRVAGGPYRVDALTLRLSAESLDQLYTNGNVVVLH